MFWLTTLLLLRDLTGQGVCYRLDGRYHLPVGESGANTIALSAESAGRVRLDACRYGEATGSMWCLDGDSERLRAIALGLLDELAVA